MTSSTSSERRIVLDVIQTQLEEREKENKRLKMKLKEVMKEKEEETELFNKKVEKLQEQFLEVEERVKLKGKRQKIIVISCMLILRIKMMNWRNVLI